MLDDLDRQITAALIRNGRASWRQIAEVLGQQERTVARRGNRLLASGEVRIHALANPSVVGEADAFLLRVSASPAAVRDVAEWLAKREDVLWASALAGASECVAEVFVPVEKIGTLLYRDLAAVEGVDGLALEPLLRYYRTVSGWRPDVLDSAQYQALGVDEDAALASQRRRPDRAVLDESNSALVEVLRGRGRATLEELSAGVGASKATVARRLDALISSGALFIRAVLDPATLGYPVEALLDLACAPESRDAVGAAVAALSTTRWSAARCEGVLVQSAVAGLPELGELVATLSAIDGVASVRFSLYAEIFKRSSTVYSGGVLPPVDEN